jgi:crotonobetainyl-CoA:carnitine CoA-transferase CaiB-like acyl-CoA transferase
VADVLADPALKACLPLIDIGLPNAAQALGSPIRYNGEFFSAERPAPAKGQHTSEVLAEIGYSTEEINSFLRDGSAFTDAT